MRALPLSQQWLPALVLAGCLAAYSAGLAQPLAPSYPPLAGDAFTETELFANANFARTREGLLPLRLDAGLTLAARHHAAEMAELGYFGHSSPRPEHETLRHRLALAGSPLVTVGENLAMVRGRSDVAQAAVEGWLDSPGHRANLLGAHFSHVGYGVATDRNGAVFVVQVLGFEAGSLERSAVQPTLLTERRITVRLRATAATEALISVAGAGDSAFALAPGQNAIRITTLAELPATTQVRAALALSGTDNSFVIQDAGWLDLRDGSWQPDDSAPRQGLVIERVELEQIRRPGAVVTLHYDMPAGQHLAVFLGDAQQREAVRGDDTVSVRMASDGGGAPLQIGVLSGREVAIFHSFTVSDRSGMPALLPAHP